MNGKEAQVSDFEHKSGSRNRVYIKTAEVSLYIDFHFNKNGSTTIDISGGAKNSIKDELSAFIMENPQCVIGDLHSKSKWFVAPDIEVNDFKAIVELLSESTYCSTGSHSSDVRQHHELHKMTGIFGEEVTIHYYYTTSKVMIQGRPLLLFNEAISYITELLDLEKIPSTFNDYFNVDIKKTNIEQVYSSFFPYSHSHHSPKLKKVLHQAIYNLQLEGDMFDYTFLAFPSLRALEGHLKYILVSNGIQLENNTFSMYNKVPGTGKYILDPSYISVLNNPAKVEYMERVYNFFKVNRHRLFHWSNPCAPIDQTPVIENLGEAKGIITSTFQIIDEYYTI